ncbi:50S ribosomal protein L6 [Flagellatimonas centrodinii]|uniref:50S ribosomal protein L6 n=1 Tax=Flagellatimonas centrodinii TaxID=2806210 RepID=UPI001FF86A9B|nr:50S ribosomal protein L6 [Flagellatimonas centrodinii]ULQ47325.1 50S ribosomal protein L6 [Flagellatimonas centrodinii]
MSRVAKNPLKLPAGVQITADGGVVTVKGAQASLSLPLPKGVALEIKDGELTMSPDSIVREPAKTGTVRAIIGNMVVGVTTGYERKLQLVGVGYRAQTQGKVVNLSLGFSHPIAYPIPEGITVETPSQTEVVVKGADKHMVGQVAADIRGFRPPEPYKGKGVRYLNEKVVMKEAKKK